MNREKKKLLENYGWYHNMRMGYTHPHAMDYMSIREINRYNLKQLEYKLKYGSQAVLPENLR